MDALRPPGLEPHALLSMSELSNHLDTLTPVTSGVPLAHTLTASRVNAIQESIKALARGENIVAGSGMLRQGVGRFVKLSSTAKNSTGGSTSVTPAQITSFQPRFGVNEHTQEPEMTIAIGFLNSKAVDGTGLDAIYTKFTDKTWYLVAVVAAGEGDEASTQVEEAYIVDDTKIPKLEEGMGIQALFTVHSIKDNTGKVTGYEAVRHVIQSLRCSCNCVGEVSFWGL